MPFSPSALIAIVGVTPRPFVFGIKGVTARGDPGWGAWRTFPTCRSLSACGVTNGTRIYGYNRRWLLDRVSVKVTFEKTNPTTGLTFWQSVSIQLCEESGFFSSFLFFNPDTCGTAALLESPLCVWCNYRPLGVWEGKGKEWEQIKDKWTLLERVRVAVTLSILTAEWTASLRLR